MKKSITTAIFLGLLALILLPQVAGAVSIDVGISYATAIGLGTRDIRATVASIINVMMGLLGIIAIVIILVGGFKWMTAMGNEDAVKSAKSLLFQGVIGLVIVLSAYAIANFVVGSILNAT
ncbi:MAG: hypothetical protein PHC97_00660 [Patescibacteria group bacterium]|nr:hypothetical protein [Patescibacteria group bacterium]